MRIEDNEFLEVVTLDPCWPMLNMLKKLTAESIRNSSLVHNFHCQPYLTMSLIEVWVWWRALCTKGVTFIL